MSNWISLHRKIRCNPLFNQKRKFSRFEAWVDMLMEANYKEKKWLSGNEMIPVKRGSFITSELKLMDRWQWSKSKVRAFLKLLENEEMIVKKTDTKRTTIFIVNYDYYQSAQTTKEPQKDYKKTAKELQKDTTNKDNKGNKDNKKKSKPEKTTYAEFVKMTTDQYQKLIKEYGQGATDRMVEILDNYKGANGRKYADDYRAIKNWVIDRYQEEAGMSGRMEDRRVVE